MPTNQLELPNLRNFSILLLILVPSFIGVVAGYCQGEKRDFEPAPILGDTLIVPDTVRLARSFDRASVSGNVAAPYPGFYDTSEYMIGSVAVGIIMPESNGTIDSSTEDWTTTEESNVVNEIQAGLNWWVSKELRANLTFSYDIHYRVPTSYEPISRTGPTGSPSGESLWINQAMIYLGYTSGDYFSKTYNYINAIRTAKNANWAFAIFVVDSSADANGMFTDSYFAYAYLGGPFMVMTYDNNGYGIGNMDAVTAHELGHIFYALDEYAGASSATARSGYLNVTNGNHEVGGITNVPCIMRGQVSPYTSGSICSYTKQQVGWRDTDGDNILDIVDVFPDSSLNVYSPDPTPNSILTFTGSVSEVPYPNKNPYGTGNSISINTIRNVQYRVDGGSWASARATDGAFDEAVEDFNFTTISLSPRSHIVEVRSINSVGNNESTFASDSVTVLGYYLKFIFKNSNGTANLYTNPFQVTLLCPNGTSLALTSYSNLKLQRGNYTVTRIVWNGNNIKPDTNLSYNLTSDYNWSINCKVYSLSFNFKNRDGTSDLYVRPSRISLLCPNGTTLTLTSYSIPQAQNGSYTVTSIKWSGVDVVPSPNPTVSLIGSSILEINCLVYNLKVKVTDLYGLPVSGAMVSLTLANGTTVTAQTGNDGIAVFLQVPQGSFTGTVSYLLQTVSISGDVAQASTTPVSAKVNFSPVVISSILIVASVIVFVFWKRRRKAPITPTVLPPKEEAPPLAPVTPTPTLPIALPTELEEAPKKTCLNCGTENPYNAVYCRKCGHSV